ncbi:SgcJ/EcaC family oxidoreductase [Nocardia panacis]|uniref:SgcJ/EcaC family oxidoreductase n=1 Tax=Nocardia panacis TaxID=2340916 RepID=A0A3A4KTX9_9NOCA|nr:SgcJ/EcaC family oxidoreductase [Nocardia panacis]RJO73314.1 SgcJ/EcaC family oxidoreductase [Nocardia panacis]
MDAEVRERFPLLRLPRFARFWFADSVSMFGTYITAQALQVLAVLVLGASAFELGMLRAAQWLPYLLFGLFAGVLVDRYRRKPVLLVAADISRAGLLALIPLAAYAHALRMWLLIAVVFVFGAASVLYDAAHQSFLPSLVPPELLTRANARLEQSSSVAQVAGQAMAGLLIKVAGSAAAVLADAVSYLISGLVLARMRVDERAGDNEHCRFGGWSHVGGIAGRNDWAGPTMQRNAMTITRTEDAAAIEQILADQYKAWAAGDADAFVADYAEEATVIMPGTYRRNREEIRLGMTESFATYLENSSVTDEIQDIRLLGADCAIAISKAGILFAGETEVPAGRFVHATWVLVKRDDRWLVAAYHNSPVAAR